MFDTRRNGVVHTPYSDIQCGRTCSVPVSNNTQSEEYKTVRYLQRSRIDFEGETSGECILLQYEIMRKAESFKCLRRFVQVRELLSLSHYGHDESI
jgi:hypothetical protein